MANMRPGNQSARCECSDPGCIGHPGVAQCQTFGRLRTLYRIDMDDRSGTRMCSDCAEDALASGLFKDGAR